MTTYRDKIKDFLIQCNFKCNYRGFEDLIDILVYLIENGTDYHNRYNISLKKVYQEIAKRKNVSYYNIQKNINTLIKNSVVKEPLNNDDKKPLNVIYTLLYNIEKLVKQ